MFARELAEEERRKASWANRSLFLYFSHFQRKNGGRGGIRTHGWFYPTLDFESSRIPLQDLRIKNPASIISAITVLWLYFLRQAADGTFQPSAKLERALHFHHGSAFGAQKGASPGRDSHSAVIRGMATENGFSNRYVFRNNRKTWSRASGPTRMVTMNLP